MSDMDEDYGFEYSDEEQDEEQVDVENQYYNAKGGRSLLFVIERRRYWMNSSFLEGSFVVFLS